MCVPLTFMVVSLGLSTYSAVKVGNHSCGSVQNFAYSESIQPELKQTLFQDVIRPNGCNRCSDKNHVPIWLAPGDMCDMQTHGRLTYHHKFQHCSTPTPSYATDFNPTDHVKACVTKEDVTYLWESGHCHDTLNTTSLPFFDSMKEGLLFCATHAWDACKLETLLPTGYGTPSLTLLKCVQQYKWFGNPGLTNKTLLKMIGEVFQTHNPTCPSSECITKFGWVSYSNLSANYCVDDMNIDDSACIV